MTNDILLDPVADGIPPKHTRVETGLIAVLLALGIWAVVRGDYWVALQDGLFAALLYILMRQRRAMWLKGYRATMLAIAEQADGIEVIDE